MTVAVTVVPVIVAVVVPTGEGAGGEEPSNQEDAEDDGNCLRRPMRSLWSGHRFPPHCSDYLLDGEHQQTSDLGRTGLMIRASVLTTTGVVNVEPKPLNIGPASGRNRTHQLVGCALTCGSS
jgi:hypothetical protein